MPGRSKRSQIESLNASYNPGNPNLAGLYGTIGMRVAVLPSVRRQVKNSGAVHTPFVKLLQPTITSGTALGSSTMFRTKAIREPAPSGEPISKNWGSVAFTTNIHGGEISLPYNNNGDVLRIEKICYYIKVDSATPWTVTDGYMTKSELVLAGKLTASDEYPIPLNPSGTAGTASAIWKAGVTIASSIGKVIQTRDSRVYFVYFSMPQADYGITSPSNLADPVPSPSSAFIDDLRVSIKAGQYGQGAASNKTTTTAKNVAPFIIDNTSPLIEPSTFKYRVLDSSGALKSDAFATTNDIVEITCTVQEAAALAVENAKFNIKNSAGSTVQTIDNTGTSSRVNISVTTSSASNVYDADDTATNDNTAIGREHDVVIQFTVLSSDLIGRIDFEFMLRDSVTGAGTIFNSKSIPTSPYLVAGLYNSGGLVKPPYLQNVAPQAFPPGTAGLSATGGGKQWFIYTTSSTSTPGIFGNTEKTLTVPSSSTAGATINASFFTEGGNDNRYAKENDYINYITHVNSPIDVEPKNVVFKIGSNTIASSKYSWHETELLVDYSLSLSSDKTEYTNYVLGTRRYEFVYQVETGEEGQVSLEYTFQDKAGNTKQIVASDNSPLIYVDTAAPTLTTASVPTLQILPINSAYTPGNTTALPGFVRREFSVAPNATGVDANDYLANGSDVINYVVRTNEPIISLQEETGGKVLKFDTSASINSINPLLYGGSNSAAGTNGNVAGSPSASILADRDDALSVSGVDYYENLLRLSVDSSDADGQAKPNNIEIMDRAGNTNTINLSSVGPVDPYVVVDNTAPSLTGTMLIKVETTAATPVDVTDNKIKTGNVLYVKGDCTVTTRVQASERLYIPNIATGSVKSECLPGFCGPDGSSKAGILSCDAAGAGTFSNFTTDVTVQKREGGTNSTNNLDYEVIFDFPNYSGNVSGELRQQNIIQDEAGNQSSTITTTGGVSAGGNTISSIVLDNVSPNLTTVGLAVVANPTTITNQTKTKAGFYNKYSQEITLTVSTTGSGLSIFDDYLVDGFITLKSKTSTNSFAKIAPTQAIASVDAASTSKAMTISSTSVTSGTAFEDLTGYVDSATFDFDATVSDAAENSTDVSSVITSPQLSVVLTAADVDTSTGANTSYVGGTTRKFQILFDKAISFLNTSGNDVTTLTNSSEQGRFSIEVFDTSGTSVATYYAADISTISKSTGDNKILEIVMNSASLSSGVATVKYDGDIDSSTTGAVIVDEAYNRTSDGSELAISGINFDNTAPTVALPTFPAGSTLVAMETTNSVVYGTSIVNNKKATKGDTLKVRFDIDKGSESWQSNVKRESATVTNVTLLDSSNSTIVGAYVSKSYVDTSGSIPSTAGYWDLEFQIPSTFSGFQGQTTVQFDIEDEDGNKQTINLDNNSFFTSGSPYTFTIDTVPLAWNTSSAYAYKVDDGSGEVTITTDTYLKQGNKLIIERQLNATDYEPSASTITTNHTSYSWDSIRSTGATVTNTSGASITAVPTVVASAANMFRMEYIVTAGDKGRLDISDLKLYDDVGNEFHAINASASLNTIFRMDTTAPAVEESFSVVDASNAAKPAFDNKFYLKLGDKITNTITITENGHFAFSSVSPNPTIIDNAKIKIGGTAVTPAPTATKSGTWTNGKLIYTLEHTVSAGEDGDILFEYDITDSAGNVFTRSTSLTEEGVATAAKSAKADTTDPDFGSPSIVTARSTEATSNLSGYYVVNNKYNSQSQGVKCNISLGTSAVSTIDANIVGGVAYLQVSADSGATYDKVNSSQKDIKAAAAAGLSDISDTATSISLEFAQTDETTVFPATTGIPYAFRVVAEDAAGNVVFDTPTPTLDVDKVKPQMDGASDAEFDNPNKKLYVKFTEDIGFLVAAAGRNGNLPHDTNLNPGNFNMFEAARVNSGTVQNSINITGIKIWTATGGIAIAGSAASNMDNYLEIQLDTTPAVWGAFGAGDKLKLAYQGNTNSASMTETNTLYDTVGNKITTDESIEIDVDTTAPALVTNGLTISSNNTRTTGTMAKEGDVVTISAEFDEALLQVPTFAIKDFFGSTITESDMSRSVSQISTNKYTCVFTIPTGFSTTLTYADGDIKFTISNIKDLSNNSATPLDETDITGLDVIIDTTMSSINGGWEKGVAGTTVFNGVTTAQYFNAADNAANDYKLIASSTDSDWLGSTTPGNEDVSFVFSDSSGETTTLYANFTNSGVPGTMIAEASLPANFFSSPPFAEGVITYSITVTDTVGNTTVESSSVPAPGAPTDMPVLNYDITAPVKIGVSNLNIVSNLPSPLSDKKIRLDIDTVTISFETAKELKNGDFIESLTYDNGVDAKNTTTAPPSITVTSVTGGFKYAAEITLKNAGTANTGDLKFVISEYEDLAGNKAADSSQDIDETDLPAGTANVEMDITAPGRVGASDSIVSDNGTNPAYCTVGNTITAVFEYNEEIVDPSDSTMWTVTGSNSQISLGGVNVDMTSTMVSDITSAPDSQKKWSVVYTIPSSTSYTSSLVELNVNAIDLAGGSTNDNGVLSNLVTFYENAPSVQSSNWLSLANINSGTNAEIELTFDQDLDEAPTVEMRFGASGTGVSATVTQVPGGGDTKWKASIDTSSAPSGASVIEWSVEKAKNKAGLETPVQPLTAFASADTSTDTCTVTLVTTTITTDGVGSVLATGNYDLPGGAVANTITLTFDSGSTHASVPVIKEIKTTGSGSDTHLKDGSDNDIADGTMSLSMAQVGTTTVYTYTTPLISNRVQQNGGVEFTVEASGVTYSGITNSSIEIYNTTGTAASITSGSVTNSDRANFPPNGYLGGGGKQNGFSGDKRGLNRNTFARAGVNRQNGAGAQYASWGSGYLGSQTSLMPWSAAVSATNSDDAQGIRIRAAGSNKSLFKATDITVSGGIGSSTPVVISGSQIFANTSNVYGKINGTGTYLHAIGIPSWALSSASSSNSGTWNMFVYSKAGTITNGGGLGTNVAMDII